jgi:hypothetical protein
VLPHRFRSSALTRLRCGSACHRTAPNPTELLVEAARSAITTQVGIEVDERLGADQWILLRACETRRKCRANASALLICGYLDIKSAGDSRLTCFLIFSFDLLRWSLDASELGVGVQARVASDREAAAGP